MDKKYWEQYYFSQNATNKPTLFAQLILKNHLKAGDTLIELGCGNGRDSIFLHKTTLVLPQ